MIPSPCDSYPDLLTTCIFPQVVDFHVDIARRRLGYQFIISADEVMFSSTLVS